MEHPVFFTPGNTPALLFAREYLVRFGCVITDRPDKTVTHLLLSAPCKETDEEISRLLQSLSPHVTVIGGNLNSPLLKDYKTIDLLKDETYLSENALITAECALSIAMQRCGHTIKGASILVLGWGRIGKHLARLLKQMDASVTVAARKESDRGLLLSLGYHAVRPEDVMLSQYRIAFNTAPAAVISEAQAAACRKDCLKIDLASVKGIPGEDVIWARGLPGKDVPESAGMLMAQSAVRLSQEELT